MSLARDLKDLNNANHALLEQIAAEERDLNTLISDNPSLQSTIGLRLEMLKKARNIIVNESTPAFIEGATMVIDHGESQAADKLYSGARLSHRKALDIVERRSGQPAPGSPKEPTHAPATPTPPPADTVDDKPKGGRDDKRVAGNKSESKAQPPTAAKAKDEDAATQAILAAIKAGQDRCDERFDGLDGNMRDVNQNLSDLTGRVQDVETSMKVLRDSGLLPIIDGMTPEQLRAALTGDRLNPEVVAALNSFNGDLSDALAAAAHGANLLGGVDKVMGPVRKYRSRKPASAPAADNKS